MYGSCSYAAQILALLTVSLVRRQPTKGQIIAKSGALSNGTGNVVDTSAAASHFQNADEQVGVNVSSFGQATGANSSAIYNSASGSVGALNVKGTGQADAKGQSANSQSKITSNIIGNNGKITISQTGTASGKGDTSASVNGAGQISGGEKNGTSNVKVVSGATGSEGSQSQASSNQEITSWTQILDQLVAKASAEGITNSQANIRLSDGGYDISGLVSGINQGKGGNVKTQVSGQVNSSGDATTSQLSGSSDDTGKSSLTGGQTVRNKNTSLTTFGSSQVDAENGNGGSKMASKSEIIRGAANANVQMEGIAQGTRNNLNVSNGIQVKDNGQKTEVVGSGTIHSSGTLNSSNTIVSNVGYRNGSGSISVHSKGSAVSDNGNVSSLSMNSDGQINSNSISIRGAGQAQGSYSSVTGYENISGSGSGNSSVVAQGAGSGASSAQSGSTIQVGKENITAQGSVSASGSKTKVYSSTVVGTQDGLRTLSNYQNATSQSSGSGSASASSNGVLIRKKRSVAELIFKEILTNGKRISVIH